MTGSLYGLACLAVGLLVAIAFALLADTTKAERDWQARFDRAEDPDPSEPGGPASTTF